ncbi:hypothetical protein [Winogradskyella alexanderae]|uniref:Uncharacterized protein n=1 Tax=Winogradskyella alexanderae TaxID=2877123 RepID=A0ABS7XP97_9FLAO|nr:hypothetical protein [Winogradskyella alexanderae]MCA0131832.1 hypothetical protein [Winogradskyella alexanderae]
MKTKTIIELLTLSSSLYVMARDAHLLDKLSDMSEKGKENLNKFMAERKLDENGNEMEFFEHIIAKTQELKDQLNEKIEKQVVAFYKKINVAHLDEIKSLNEKLEDLDATVALLEARINHLEKE